MRQQSALNQESCLGIARKMTFSTNLSEFKAIYAHVMRCYSKDVGYKDEDILI